MNETSNFTLIQVDPGLNSTGNHIELIKKVKENWALPIDIKHFITLKKIVLCLSNCFRVNSQTGDWLLVNLKNYPQLPM